MASEAKQETRLCGNCKHDVPVINFTIHEIHCRRNISMCKVCKEPFPTSDMEEHMTREHTPVTCKCKMTMEKYELEEHERSACPLRLLKCQFCELELAVNKLEDHEEYCGARTERCDNCGCSVMTKDLQDHPVHCGKVTAPKKPARVHSWTETDYEGSWFEPFSSRSTFTDNMYSQMPKHLPSRFYGNSILTQSLKAFDDEVAQNTRRAQNRVREQTNVPRDIPVHTWQQLPEERPNAQRDYDTFQSLSNRDATLFNPGPDPPYTGRGKDFWVNFYSKDSVKKMTSHEQSSPNYFYEDDPLPIDVPSPPTTDDIQLPCEFCEELFPEQDLILHQSGCKPSASFFNRRPSPSPLEDLIQNPRSSPPAVDYSHSILIPCEFCGVLMEGEILFHHQDQCDMGPNAGKSSPHLTSLLTDDSQVEEYRTPDIPSASQSHQGHRADNTTASCNRYQIRENASNPLHPAKANDALGGLYRQTEMNNSLLRYSNLDEMRKRNIQENSRVLSSHHNDLHRPALSSAASNRHAGTRDKPKKKINAGAGAEDVDKEE
ncbi:TRAF-type zinc finger domain-containing protein 1 [Pseudophryne corroboree]|uniref:TRAF-type zinc finger domain-containing protein 1 n=1 Tax=Pseudophryne corroboree TaxID=495146 RepID=UPI003081A1BA